LVGYWRLGETSGTVASDVKGAHPGEYEGGVTLGVPGLISGDPNTAVFFDGTSGDVTVPPSAAGPAAALNPSKFSVEAWVKPQDPPGIDRAVVSSIDIPGKAGYAIVAGSSGSWAAWVGDGTSLQTLDSGVHIHPGQPAYLILTFDGSKLILGVDGALVEAPSLTVSNFKANTTRHLVIGGGSNFFHGVIDEVAFYNDALSQERVAVHFASNGAAPSPAGPTAVTGDATGITYDWARLTGTVNPHGQPTTYHFDYGETAAYGSATPDSSAGSGNVDQAESAAVTGLSPNTAYHYRIAAQSGAGVGQGSDHQFKTLPSTKYRDAVLLATAADLLSYWRLDEPMGTMAFDSVPLPATKNTGNYIGGVALNQPGALTADPNAAVLFNGTDAEMTANGPVLSGACSIEGWFYWTGGRGLLSDDVTGGAGWRFAFDVNGKLNYRLAGTSFTTPVATASVQNNWHHFVATKDAAGNVAFYLDGQSIHTGAGAGNTAAQMPWHLMRDRPSGQYTAGTADEVAMYGVALPASTVLDHFNIAKSG
ncbi:MAG: LamG-like jellyroll fold domain-containing protein, partial [Solirubrobacteraceae bacterium]